MLKADGMTFIRPVAEAAEAIGLQSNAYRLARKHRGTAVHCSIDTGSGLKALPEEWLLKPF